jgi:hypothetical protein
MPKNNDFETILNAINVIVKQVITDIPIIYHKSIPHLPSPLPSYDPTLTIEEYLSKYYPYPVTITPLPASDPISNSKNEIMYYSKIQASIAGLLMNNNVIAASGNCTSQTNNDADGYGQAYADWLAGVPAVEDAINEANKIISQYNTNIETNMKLIDYTIAAIKEIRPLSIG